MWLHIRRFVHHPHSCCGAAPAPWWGTIQASIFAMADYVQEFAPWFEIRTPAGGGSLTDFRPWAHQDQGQLWCDNEAYNSVHERVALAYEDYKSKYLRRYDSLDFDAQKHGNQDRMTQHRPRVWIGYLDGVEMARLRLVSSHVAVFQPEQQEDHLKRE